MTLDALRRLIKKSDLIALRRELDAAVGPNLSNQFSRTLLMLAARKLECEQDWHPGSRLRSTAGFQRMGQCYANNLASNGVAGAAASADHDPC